MNQTGKRKARILVVDDDPGLLRLLTIRLRAESYDVEAVESAAQALAASSRFRPDLVITDLRMPNMDGLEFTLRLRKEPGGSTLPVIFYTATFLQGEARAMAATCGVTQVLMKPCGPQEILAAVAISLGVPVFQPPA
ncbi:MAG TPA: response regulator, partial [Steroidobacteraceae bacterium]|nr:response regulator [Steroidobacteraceae bacterium]